MNMLEIIRHFFKGLQTQNNLSNFLHVIFLCKVQETQMPIQKEKF